MSEGPERGRRVCSFLSPPAPTLYWYPEAQNFPSQGQFEGYYFRLYKRTLGSASWTVTGLVTVRMVFSGIHFLWTYGLVSGIWSLLIL